MDKCEHCQFPSKTEMAKNLAFSFVNVVGEAFRTGKLVATKEEIKKRMDICDACSHKVENRCSECGCFLTYKVGLNAEKCPLGKW